MPYDKAMVHWLALSKKDMLESIVEYCITYGIDALNVAITIVHDGKTPKIQSVDCDDVGIKMLIHRPSSYIDEKLHQLSIKSDEGINCQQTVRFRLSIDGEHGTFYFPNGALAIFNTNKDRLIGPWSMAGFIQD